MQGLPSVARREPRARAPRGVRRRGKGRVFGRKRGGRGTRLAVFAWLGTARDLRGRVASRADERHLTAEGAAGCGAEVLRWRC